MGEANLKISPLKFLSLYKSIKNKEDIMSKSLFKISCIFGFLFIIYCNNIKEAISMKSPIQIAEIETQLEQHEQATGHQARRSHTPPISNVPFAENFLSRGGYCFICNDYLTYIEKLRRIFEVNNYEENTSKDNQGSSSYVNRQIFKDPER
jgi:hypothetical protein